MLKVEKLRYCELTEEEQKTQPNNGRGKHEAHYIKLSFTTDEEEKTLMILSDAVEPEDATFHRDFSGVIDALELAYQKGIEVGQSEDVKKRIREVGFLKDTINDLTNMISDYEECGECNGTGMNGVPLKNGHPSLVCEKCDGEGFVKKGRGW